MSDAGAIGGILEDMIDVLRYMYKQKELPLEKLRFGLLLIYSINNNCKEQGIDLYMEKEYMEYIQEFLPNKR